MRIESEFRKTFLLSMMLHLLVILIFNVSLMSARGKLKKESEVYFYGSLFANVEKVEDVKVLPAVTSRLDKKIKSFLTERLSPLPDNSYSKEAFYVKLEKPYVEMTTDRKALPYFKTENVDFVGLARVDSLQGKDEDKAVDLKDLVFCKLPFSELVYLEDDENFNFRMRIFISSEGKIEFVEPLFFSGRPELDILVKKLIKEWSLLPYGNTAGWHEINFNPKLVSVGKSVY